MPLCDTALTGTSRLRIGQVEGATGLWLHLLEFDLGLGDLEVIWRLGSFPSHLGSLKWGGDLLSPKIVCPLHGSLFPELMSASVT